MESQQAPVASVADWEELDPLYDPAFAIFIYAGWAFMDYLVGPMAGLVVLVGATALLAVVSLTNEREPETRPFIADFSTVLLFCAASIGAAVLVLRAL